MAVIFDDPSLHLVSFLRDYPFWFFRRYSISGHLGFMAFYFLFSYNRVQVAVFVFKIEWPT